MVERSSHFLHHFFEEHFGACFPSQAFSWCIVEEVTELLSVVTALKSANSILPVPLFDWNMVSDTPGLLSGSCGIIARAMPTIFDHNLCEYLIPAARISDTFIWF
jgi:hypothetical protein